MKLRNFLVLLLLVLLVTSCDRPGTGLTAEEAVRRTFPSVAEGGPRYQIAGTRQAPAGVVVLYGEESPDSDGSHNLGYAFVERRSWRWDVRSGRSGNMTPDAASRAIYLVGELNAGERPDDPAPTIVFGQVLDPVMVAVAVKPAAGEIVEDVVTNGMFAVVFPPLIAPCMIRFLDSSGGLVQEADLVISPPAGLPGEWLQRIQDQCQQQR